MRTQKKFGLRSVRLPNSVVATLSDEHAKLDRGPPMRYYIRLVTPREGPPQLYVSSHAVYLCNAAGRRLSDAAVHYFTPKRYGKRRPATTAPGYSHELRDDEPYSEGPLG